MRNVDWEMRNGVMGNVVFSWVEDVRRMNFDRFEVAWKRLDHRH
jgi:hypothetical protein